ncbi:protein of unknown function [Candidatus Hydrogenisulfobacillus filiaventi]|uniref:Uncharacterized protein n=1 Tax=Candidatus Hydrogenisulfobacillus filiaventi TaxID=2707344 RepID=A0A6F8ZEL5_9FIRM|nr:protein of unknown function [Candidatus Hydrogenisulfobacillus filiaventi]
MLAPAPAAYPYSYYFDFIQGPNNGCIFIHKPV